MIQLVNSNQNKVYCFLTFSVVTNLGHYQIKYVKYHFFHHVNLVKTGVWMPFQKFTPCLATPSKDCNFSNPFLESTPSGNWHLRSTTAPPPRNWTLTYCSKILITLQNCLVVLNTKTLMSGGAKQTLKLKKKHLFLMKNTK